LTFFGATAWQGNTKAIGRPKSAGSIRQNSPGFIVPIAAMYLLLIDFIGKFEDLVNYKDHGLRVSKYAISLGH
jgi:hypothetical protein